MGMAILMVMLMETGTARAKAPQGADCARLPEQIAARLPWTLGSWQESS